MFGNTCWRAAIFALVLQLSELSDLLLKAEDDGVRASAWMTPFAVLDVGEVRASAWITFSRRLVTMTSDLEPRTMGSIRVDVHLDGVIEVSRISSKDQTLQSTREPFLDVPVPRLIEHLVDVPTIVCQDRIRQRTFEQFSDISVFKVFLQDTVQHSFC